MKKTSQSLAGLANLGAPQLEEKIAAAATGRAASLGWQRRPPHRDTVQSIIYHFSVFGNNLDLD
jgi:hypothetical protein